MSMQTSTWQPSLGMDWAMPHQPPHQQYYRHQYPAYHLLGLANETPSKVYKRRASRVTKPSSAGNSPHSLLPNVPRRRTMTGQSAAHHSFAMMDTALIQQQQHQQQQERKSRPTSWHPSPSQHAALDPYLQNCHPSWFAPAGSTGLSEPTLSMPITCPVSGDLISNDSFAMLDNIHNGYYGSTMNEAYTPAEPADMIYPDWSSGSMAPMAVPDPLWTQQLSTCSSGYLASDQVADFGCHESVASSDPSTAPVTPDLTTSYATDSHQSSCKPGPDQFALPPTADGEDDLVALGLYDEPQSVSLSTGGSLLGSTLLVDDSAPPAGKGLKLEETFSPAEAEEEDEDDAEHEDD